MTKEEAQQVWAAASEYRWRGFDHWWKEEGSRGPPPLYTPVPTSCREFENVNIGIYDNNRGMKETTEWIKTSERLPEENQSVLALCLKDVEAFGESEIEVVRWRDNGKRRDRDNGDVRKNYFTDILTHWRPLPELPPKEGKE